MCVCARVCVCVCVCERSQRVSVWASSFSEATFRWSRTKSHAQELFGGRQWTQTTQWSFLQSANKLALRLVPAAELCACDVSLARISSTHFARAEAERSAKLASRTHFEKSPKVFMCSCFTVLFPNNSEGRFQFFACQMP